MIQTKHTLSHTKPLEQQVRRIRWKAGVSDATARTIAGLIFGEAR